MIEGLHYQPDFVDAETEQNYSKRLMPKSGRIRSSVGCSIMAMSSLATMEPEKVDRIYRKLGYTLAEHAYVKSL